MVNNVVVIPLLLFNDLVVVAALRLALTLVTLVLAAGVLDALELLKHFIVLRSSLRDRNQIGSALEEQQVLRTGDSGQPVSNDDDSQLLAGLSNLVDGFLNFDFALGVQSGGRFVQNQDLGLFDQGSSNGNSLLLSTRHIEDTSCADKGVHAFLLVEHEVSACLVQGVFALFVGSVLVAVQQVVFNASHDHDGLLGNVADVFSQDFQVDVANVLAIKVDVSASSWVVKPLNELNNGGLARARGAHDGSRLSCFDCEVSLLEHGLVLREGRRVLEGDVGELDLFVKRKVLATLAILVVSDFRDALDDVKDKSTESLGGHDGLNVRQGADEADEASDEGDQHREHVLHGVRVVCRAVFMVIDDEKGTSVHGVRIEEKDGELHDAHHKRVSAHGLLGNALCALGPLGELAQLAVLSAEGCYHLDGGQGLLGDTTKVLDNRKLLKCRFLDHPTKNCNNDEQ